MRRPTRSTLDKGGEGSGRSLGSIPFFGEDCPTASTKAVVQYESGFSYVSSTSKSRCERSGPMGTCPNNRRAGWWYLETKKNIFSADSRRAGGLENTYKTRYRGNRGNRCVNHCKRRRNCGNRGNHKKKLNELSLLNVSTVSTVPMSSKAVYTLVSTVSAFAQGIHINVYHRLYSY